LDPEAREVVLGPIEVKDHAHPMAFDGQRLWVFDFWSLYPVDAESGQLGTVIEVPGTINSIVYDGVRIWFNTQIKKGQSWTPAVQAIDPVSRELLPPVETGMAFWPTLVPDKSRHVLWVIDSSGQVQAYDLQSKVLRDTTIRFDGVGMGPTRSPVLFDGQRLWAIRIGPSERESIGQSLDVDTGKVTQLPGSPAAIVSSVFDGKRIWLSNEDGTVQPFDTITGQLGTPIPVSGYPGDLAFDGKRLWIALYDNPSSISQDERHFVGLQYLVPQED